jgi:outer membrane protein OmpA-like peptidoglycan-associated protein
VLSAFKRGDIRDAYQLLTAASPHAEALAKSAEFSKIAGLINLQVGMPNQALDWWRKYAERDEAGKVLLAGGLFASGDQATGRAMAESISGPISLTATEVQEIRSAVPGAALEKAGLNIVQTGLLRQAFKAVRPFSGTTVLFDPSSTRLSTEGQSQLRHFAQGIHGIKRGSIIVTGYAGEGKTREYNLSLAELRANAVAAALTEFGIDPKRLRLLWREASPLGPWRDAEELSRQASVTAVEDK